MCMCYVSWHLASFRRHYCCWNPICVLWACFSHAARMVTDAFALFLSRSVLLTVCAGAVRTVGRFGRFGRFGVSVVGGGGCCRRDLVLVFTGGFWWVAALLATQHRVCVPAEEGRLLNSTNRECRALVFSRWVYAILVGVVGCRYTPSIFFLNGRSLL